MQVAHNVADRVALMTIQVQLSAETEARLSAQAAEHSMDLPSYAASLLEQATYAKPDAEAKTSRPPGRKSLAQLFADSPFAGLDIEVERDKDFGRDAEL